MKPKTGLRAGILHSKPGPNPAGRVCNTLETNGVEINAQEREATPESYTTQIITWRTLHTREISTMSRIKVITTNVSLSAERECMSAPDDGEI